MMIEDIEMIAGRYEGIENTLNDREEYDAVMICLLQLGESMSKIKDERIVDKLPVNLSYAMRNIIAHDYLAININRIIETLKDDIPKLKKKIMEILEANN
jgi:uncharacterized protein with HEPN domain